MINAHSQSWIADLDKGTVERLKIYHDLLLKWKSVKNLISNNSYNDIWTRHFQDSAQILDLVETPKSWIDIGSGGGFPGLVVAILLSEKNQCRVQLIDSDHRKCAFLRHVSRETGVAVEVHCGRIEEILPGLSRPDVISARALAPMKQLLDWSAPFIEKGTIGLFLKGQDVDKELTDISIYSNFKMQMVESKTDPKAKIVLVST
ncbi:MAG: 16S rRNA (guanine(527)-N(7))-methyltransferase RsmG [Methylocystaceae bacterium]|nr:16S rRNA (guanine(527)-N(7))-methyltransferase RsmG [Methylocystaceae bacterium]